ncbi:MAG: molecular chaperone DnaJ [Candidatus Woesearchaeota archaeon]
MAKDYYKILGVGKDASKEDIKKAYKSLAKKHHPDLNKESGSAEKFKEINEAYTALSDDTKRSNYDRFGDSGEQFSGFQGGNYNEEMFSDIFDNFFEGSIFGGARKGRRKGADLKYELEITFEEAAFGTKKKIGINKLGRCDKCDGTGAEDGKVVQCEACGGRGQVRQQFRTPFGIVQQSAVCSACRGSGKVAKNACSECGGKGRKKVSKSITISIPAGVDNGSTLRVADEGEAGEFGASAGNLYVEVYVRPHPIFERDGNDITLEVPISFAQAALGDEIKVPTLEGEVTMKLPAGTQSHSLFRLKAKGIPYLDGYGRGDEIVRIIVKTPKSLSQNQKKLLHEFAKENKENLKIEKGFFDKVRDALISD